MDEIKEKFINDLNESIKWHYSRYRLLSVLQWSIMILVAIAGVFTTAAGLPGASNQWLSKPITLLLCGGIVAVGATINQVGNPGKSTQHQLNIKLAFKAIRGAVEFRNMPIDLAQQFRTSGYKTPEETIEKVNQWHSS